MRGAVKVLIGVVIFIIVVPILAIGYFVATFDPNAFKNQVTQQVSQAIGRQVTVAGPVNLSFHNGVALGLKQVSIGNPPGFPEKDFANAETLFVSLDWQALLVRKVNIDQVTLSNAGLTLITNPSGQNNWDFKFGQKQPVAPPPGTKPAANMVDEIKQAAQEGRAPDLSINSVALNNVELTNTSIKQIDMRSGKHQEFLIKHATLKIPASGSFHGETQALINGAPFEIKLDTKKSLREVQEGTPIPFTLHVSYNGQVYDVKADLSFKGKTYRLADMQAQAFGASWSGTLQADMSGTLPYLSGNVSTPELNLTKLSAGRQAANGQLLATPIAASSATPNLSALQSFNSDLGFTTPRLVVSGTMAFENVNTRIKVNNGVLTLDPLKITYDGVPWAGAVSADAATNVHVILRATNVDYTHLAQSFGTKSPVDSHGDLSFDLTGRGLTAQSFLATSSGKMEFTSGSGNVDWNGGGGLGGAIVKTVLPASSNAKPHLTCAVVRFNDQGGVLHANGLLLESNYATVGGQGTVDLRNQTADLTLRPVPKGATTVSSLTTSAPIHVSGPLNNLSYFPEPDTLVKNALTGLVGANKKINTGVPQVNANAPGNPCVVALNNPQMIMVDAPNATQVFKDVRDQAKDLYKGLKGGAQSVGGSAGSGVGNAIQNLKGLFGK